MLYQRAKVFRIFSNGWSWNMKIPLCQAVNKAVLTFATVRLPPFRQDCSPGFRITSCPLECILTFPVSRVVRTTDSFA